MVLWLIGYLNYTQKSVRPVLVTYLTLQAFELPPCKDKQLRSPRRYVYNLPDLHDIHIMSNVSRENI